MFARKSSRPYRGVLGIGFLRIPFMVAALFIGISVHAQDTLPELDRLFNWIAPDSPGCVVAVSQHGKVVVNRAYGSADLERKVPLTPENVFDVGSVVKQFVAASVLLLVEDGRLSLSEDIRSYIPELPDYGYRITIDHLLTHTSGLRDWTGLQMISGEDVDALTLILRQRSLNFEPGEEWSYSNSGYVLLKEIVARMTGMPISDFMRRRLFEPLGMNATVYAADIRASDKGALAYRKSGDGWKPDMLFGNERGGGGALLSTAADLLIWNEALSHSTLGAFVTEKLQEPARLRNGRVLRYARGLFLDVNRGGNVVWHTGSAGGYKTMLARFPEQGLSIAVVSNAGDITDRMISIRSIYDLFVPADIASSQAKAPAAISGEIVPEGTDAAGKAGLFFNEQTGEPLRLVANGGRLGITGGPALAAMSGDRFRNTAGSLEFMSQDEFELRFLSRDKFVVRSMEGRETTYRRAVPFSPRGAELQAYTGRFESDEARASFEISQGKNGLAVCLNGLPGVEFVPVDRDTFQRGMMTVRFRRNGQGKIVALDYGNPVLRNITFARMTEGADR